MKKYKFFALAFAALTLGACSSDDVVDNGQGGIVPAGEPGYVSLAINLPTQPSTRAEDFDDGTPEEYDVQNATLLLFAGASESAAKFASAYDLPVTGFNTDGTTDQITEKATIVKEITVPTTAAGENIYALVVLNDNNIITIGENNSATIGGESFTGTLTDLTTKVVATVDDAADLTGQGFLMSNAPLYSAQGGTVAPAGTVSTLAEIDKSKIYSTEAMASANPATTIYVERAVAKVTVNATDNSNVGQNNIAAYTIDGWTLDVTNKKTYLVRNVAPQTSWWAYKAEGSTDYRFVGSLPVAEGFYRTYWGQDPNYDAYVAADFNVAAGTTPADETLEAPGQTTPLYCLENTFNVENMNENQTTRVILKASLDVNGAEEGTGDFYILNGVTSQIYTNAGVINEIKRQIQIWIENNKATYFTGNVQITENDLTVTLPTSTGGYVDITRVVLNSGVVADDAWAAGQDLNSFNEALKTEVARLNENGLSIAYYKNGESYYPIKIRHFDDSQTPWTANSDGISYDNSDESKYLGRYGALRNNWYDITVNGIRNIGYPEVPDVTNKPDDPENSYISVSINVLSWAKRTQSADL